MIIAILSTQRNKQRPLNKQILIESILEKYWKYNLMKIKLPNRKLDNRKYLLEAEYQKILSMILTKFSKMFWNKLWIKAPFRLNQEWYRMQAKVRISNSLWILHKSFMILSNLIKVIWMMDSQMNNRTSKSSLIIKLFLQTNTFNEQIFVDKMILN